MDVRVQTGPLPGALCCVTHQAGALEATNVGELCGHLHLPDTLLAVDTFSFLAEGASLSGFSPPGSSAASAV